MRSFGTEGRKGRPEEEIAPSDQVYEYIVFRGSDVKDLRIEDHPNIKENKPPAVPDDPAIVGVSHSLISRRCSLSSSSHMMKYFGCKTLSLSESAKNNVEISVAFLLIGKPCCHVVAILVECI